MPNIGRHYIPTIDVEEAGVVAAEIASQFRGEISVDGLATHLRMAAGGGAFRTKLASLSRYGLLQGRGQLTTTSLAEEIAFGSEEDKARALGQAFRLIPLFDELYGRLSGGPASENHLRIVVNEITSATPRELSLHIARLMRFYEVGRRYADAGTGSRRVPAERGETDDPGGFTVEDVKSATASAQHGQSAVESGMILLTDGQQRWVVPRTVGGIVVLRKYLDVLELQLGESSDSLEEAGVP